MIDRTAKPLDHAVAEDRVAASKEVDLERLAHELRSPLAAIQSTADALAGGHLGPVDPHLAGYLASIRDTARHALAVIARMAGTGHGLAGSDGRAEPIELAQLAAAVVGGMRLLGARSGVRLEVDAGGAPVIAWASPTDVRQMLINLVSNGIAHAGGGATVSVATGSDGREAWIEIADDGPGVAAGVLARLDAGAPLDADPVAPGARIRLGLTLTRQLAQASGGRLEIASGPGGTRARMVLPVPPGEDSPRG